MLFKNKCLTFKRLSQVWYLIFELVIFQWKKDASSKETFVSSMNGCMQVYPTYIYGYISIVEKSIISYFEYFTRKASWLVTDHDYRHIPSVFLMLIPILQLRHVFMLSYLSYYSFCLNVLIQ